MPDGSTDGGSGCRACAPVQALALRTIADRIEQGDAACVYPIIAFGALPGVSTSTQSESVTPGELLSEEFLVPFEITTCRLANEIGMPVQRIDEVVAGKRAITADTDLRLCRFLGLSKGFWLRAQIDYDTEVAEEALAEELARIEPWSDSGA
jgi:addiction module HigA family antidote